MNYTVKEFMDWKVRRREDSWLSDRKLEWGSNPHLARLPVLPEPPRDVEEKSLNIEMNIIVKKV
jgi:hypothetical protein